MAKSTTKPFEATLLNQRTQAGGFGASLVLHIAFGLILAVLPATYVERLEVPKQQAAIPLIMPRISAVENPAPPKRQPKPRALPKAPASPVPVKVQAQRFTAPAPDDVRAPSPAAVSIEPTPLAARITPVRLLPHAEPPPVPALEPPVRTGLLPDAARARAMQEPPKLQVRAGTFAGVEPEFQRRNGAATKTGSFGVAPEASVVPAETARRTVAVANFGGTHLENDTRARAPRTLASAASFGAATAHEALGKVSEPVQQTAFKNVVVEQRPRERPRNKSEKDRSSQVHIIEKLRPAYTAAAREQQIEGEVVLDVLFQASGTVQVLRIIEGLGYGLDARAVEAARKIRFKPAEREGKPIDSRARVRIRFQLAY